MKDHLREDGPGIVYSLAKLNDIKPSMIAVATKDAGRMRRRRAARQGFGHQRRCDQAGDPLLFLDRRTGRRSFG